MPPVNERKKHTKHEITKHCQPLCMTIILKHALSKHATDKKLARMVKANGGGGGGGTPDNGLCGEAPPERGTFFRLQVYKKVGISQVEVYKRVGKSVIYCRYFE